MKKRSLVSAIACGLGAAIMAGPTWAIDYQPFDWVPLPRGTKVLSLYYEYGAHDSYNNTIAAANAKNGAVYPPGSVVQLVPGEAMVKLDKGASPATHDWEYFELDVSKDGTRIRRRGFADVINRFGGNCFGCHVAARPEWDSICETDHGCAPIPVTCAMSAALQRTDPRCGNTSVSPEDAEALRQLDELTKALARVAK